MSVGIGLGLDGPGTTAEGDYTLGVSTSGPVADAEITVNWGDGFQTTGVGAGDYVHSLSTSGLNYEGDVPLTDYTITAQAVARAQAPVAGRSSVTDAAVDSLGRRVTVGGSDVGSGWQVRRYNADGSVDTTFSGDGLFEVPVVGGNAFAVAVDASDNIVVGGESGADQFTVARVLANGTIDTSFGAGGADGDGVVTTTFGAESSADAIAIQPDGRIVVAGTSGTSANVGLGDFVVARYHAVAGGVAPNAYAAGDLDATFDIDGKATTPVGGFSSLSDVAVGGDGRIVTVGTRFSTGDQAGAVVAFTSAGAADGTYFINAIAGNEIATAVALGGDGSIYVAENSGNGHLILAKLTAAGAVDTSFGNGDGSEIHEYQPLGDFGNVAPATFDSVVRSLVVMDDLSLVAGGTLVNPSFRTGPGFPSGDPQGFQGGLAVFRFDADGNKDLAFDGDGVVYTGGGSGSGSELSGGQLALAGDTLVQSGTVQDGPSGEGASDAMGVYVETATYAVAVTNVAPTAFFTPTDTTGDGEFIPPSNLGTATPGDVAAFAFHVTDASVADASSLIVHIDWGDGTAESFASGATYFGDPSLGFPLYVGHEFQASGPVTVKVTVTDEDGVASAVQSLVVNVAATSGIVSDPVNPGQTVLYYAAPVSPLANKIHVSSNTSSTSVALGGNTVFFAANPVDRIVVYGNYGDDTIQVNGSTSAAAMEFHGGPGNDKLKGGNKADVIVGGAGDDMVVGGVGRDLLVGGFGEDKLVGDADDDILIGGVYLDAGSREAVAAVMAEWTSSGTYAQRVYNLRHGVSSPNESGPYGLVGHDTAQEMYETNGQLVQNVFDDLASDKLTGDAGTDWFFANVDGTAKDKITDLLSSEFTDADREFVAS